MKLCTCTVDRLGEYSQGTYYLNDADVDSWAWQCLAGLDHRGDVLRDLPWKGNKLTIDGMTLEVVTAEPEGPFGGRAAYLQAVYEQRLMEAGDDDFMFKWHEDRLKALEQGNYTVESLDKDICTVHYAGTYSSVVLKPLIRRDFQVNRWVTRQIELVKGDIARLKQERADLEAQTLERLQEFLERLP